MSAIAERALSVTWSVPQAINAPRIDLYNISFTEADSVVVEYADSTALLSNLTGLQPFTEYSVAVQACTSAGCGGFSTAVNATTLQEGMSYMYSCIV